MRRATDSRDGETKVTSRTMRVMELPGVDGPLRPAERPVPEPGPGEVRVRIDACGVCGSDHFLQAGGFGPAVPFPIVPGHEAAGRIDVTIVQPVAGVLRIDAHYPLQTAAGRIEAEQPGAQAAEESATRAGKDECGRFRRAERTDRGLRLPRGSPWPGPPHRAQSVIGAN